MTVLQEMGEHISNLNHPENKIALTYEDIHVWRVELDRSQIEIDRSFNFLSPDEQIRASQFYFSKDRSRFIMAHGALRTILSLYLGVTPEKIRISSTPDRKPVLADFHKTGNGNIFFNLSHAGGIALTAVALNRHVGIDIEFIHPDLDCDPLISRFFSPIEQEALEALPTPERKLMFYRHWVLKEAYIKAKGEGLSCPLESFSVSFDETENTPLLEVPTDPVESSRWSMKELRPGHGFLGALVAEGHGWNMKSHEFDGF